MQAKNYAAQILTTDNENTPDELRTIIRSLKDAVIFNLPDGGYLTIDPKLSSRNCDFERIILLGILPNIFSFNLISFIYFSFFISFRKRI